MARPDLNLLFVLDVLLAEGSVARAARRLRLSPSAMSRALARVRAATGDPLLVRAGRALVPTPHALELRERVGPLVQGAADLLRPAGRLELARLARTFTIRSTDGFLENLGAALLARVAEEAPGVRLRFTTKPDKDSAPLRDGTVDLETGVAAGTSGPELRVQALFRDRWVGVVRAGHPLGAGPMTPARYASGQHVLVSRRGLDRGPMDDALAPLGLARDIVAVVDGYAGALWLARASDLVATVPELQTGFLRDGMFSFPLPVATPELPISLLWHPRLDADPAHRWLRARVREVCEAHLARVVRAGLSNGRRN
ncbi:MAG TPA: LysR family transcriptional regulator [Anaeromyxobacter sp.]|nr:LysR family transcriptional regulator [Anaeromyxobacter sp.]